MDRKVNSKPFNIKSKNASLKIAVKNGKKRQITALLKEGADINCLDSSGYAPLHIAVNMGNLSIATHLIKAGADVDAKINCRSPPLHLAAIKKYNDVAKMLIKAGANVETRCYWGTTALHQACVNNLDLLNILISVGADVNATSNGGGTPLYTAIEYGNLDIVKTLVKAGGTSVFYDDLQPTTLLNVAIFFKKLNIIRYLIEAGADLNEKDSIGFSPLTNPRCTPVAAKLLIDANADVNLKGFSEQTPLHMFSFVGSTTIVQYLLEAGAKVDIKDSLGKLPIELAIQNGHFEIYRLLIKYTVLTDENAQDTTPDYIKTRPILAAIWDKCRNEAKILKAPILSRSTVSYNKFLLETDENNLANYISLTKSEDYTDFLNATNKRKKNFPIYSKMIGHNINKAKQRLQRLQRCKKILKKSEMEKLPIELRIKILSSLNNSNLINLGGKPRVKTGQLRSHRFKLRHSSLRRQPQENLEIRNKRTCTH